MSQTDRIREIIATYSVTGPGTRLLEGALRSRLGETASQAEVDNAVGFCRDIINAVPVLLDRVREAARMHGLSPLVEPVLEHAETYFVSPRDALPEAMFGQAGLLDDAYLALSVIKLVQTEERPLVEIDLSQPLSFLEKVLPDAELETLRQERAKAFQALLAAVQSLADGTAARRQRDAAEEARQRPPAPPPPAAPPRRQPAPPPTAPSPRRRQCGACSGMGRITCSACGGYGSHTRNSTRIDWQGRT